MTMSFQGTGHRLTDSDVDHVAVMLGTDAAHIRAVLQVETAGSGFDPQGRPRMLFEPHVFYRLLKSPGHTPSQLRVAVNVGVAYPNQGMHPYPRDSYPQLERAIMISETTALESASWGIGQVMGENYARAGYGSVQAMVLGACDGEASQLHAVGRFIKASQGMLRALQTKDWEGFATLYNGLGNYKAYGFKLETAYLDIMDALAPVSNTTTVGIA